MSSETPYYVNLVVMLALLLVGAASGYFAARRNGQETVVSLKNELIITLSQKLKVLEDNLHEQNAQFDAQLHTQRTQFETEINKLKQENMRLTALIDDLMTMDEARRRAATRKKVAPPPVVGKKPTGTS